MKGYREIESPVIEEVQSFKVYLQISTVKVNETGFWDTVKEVKENEFISCEPEWDKLVTDYLNKGLRVRMLGERFVKISSYTEIVKA